MQERVCFDKNSSAQFAYRLKKNHYIEVTQGGVYVRARHNWLWIFSLPVCNLDNPKIVVFSLIQGHRTRFETFQTNKFSWFINILIKMKTLKKPLKNSILYDQIYFFIITNRHKISPNLIFCFMKMAPYHNGTC